jgi:uncharacterized RDD family membrane protein YckC
MSIENPYQAPTSFVADLPPGGKLEAADRGTRLAAAIVDGLIYSVLGIAAAIAAPVMLISRRHGLSASPAMAGFFMCIGLGFLGILAWNLVWLHKYGQSIGKRALNIRIVCNSDLSRVGLGRIFVLRMLVPGLIGAIPYLGWIFSLVNICFIFRDDRRCIHDHMADTVVVKA